MGKWVSCGKRLVVGDVIRWTEPVWRESRKRGKAKKPVRKVGERRVTGEVLALDASGYVTLSVCDCDILSAKDGPPLEPLKKKQVIKRKMSTIGKGSAERLKWSEEGARELAASKFLS